MIYCRRSSGHLKGQSLPPLLHDPRITSFALSWSDLGLTLILISRWCLMMAKFLTDSCNILSYLCLHVTIPSTWTILGSYHRKGNSYLFQRSGAHRKGQQIPGGKSFWHQLICLSRLFHLFHGDPSILKILTALSSRRATGLRSEHSTI